MLAHARPVRTGARHLDFAGARKQAVSLPAHPLHHIFRKLPLKQLDKRADRTKAVLADRFPARLRDRANLDLYRIDVCAAHLRSDLAALDLQIDDRTVTYICSAARQTVRVIGIALQILAPRLAPEIARDRAALDDHRRDGVALLLQLLRFAHRQK